MNHATRVLCTTAAAACSLWLAACAATEPATQAAAPAASGAAARADNSIAGTRLPVATTDRMVKQIGNAGAREMAREKPPNPGSPSN